MNCKNKFSTFAPLKNTYITYKSVSYTHLFTTHSKATLQYVYVERFCLIVILNCQKSKFEATILKVKHKTNDIWLLFGFCLTEFFIVCKCVCVWVFFLAYVCMRCVWQRSHICVIRVRFCIACRLGSNLNFLRVQFFFVLWVKILALFNFSLKSGNLNFALYSILSLNCPF